MGLMSSIEQLFKSLTAEQRKQFEELLAGGATPPAKQYYNNEQAVQVTFKAKLKVHERSKNTHYAETYSHVWCKGHYRLIGPKGGKYFVGRMVMGVKKGAQVKGILRVNSDKFENFLAGEELDAWFKLDKSKDATLIGVLYDPTVG